MKRNLKNKKKHSYSVAVFTFIGLIVVMVYVYMLSDAQLYIDDSSFNEAQQQIVDSKSGFRGVDKILDILYGSSNQGNSSVNNNLAESDLWNGIPRDYYSFMYVYEAAGAFDINPRDGGFGPYQATQPIKPLIIGIYEYDPDFFSWWKICHDNPNDYCNPSNGYATVDGSKKLEAIAKANLKTPDDYLMWYAACFSTSTKYMNLAISNAENYLGKPNAELGRGTMALSFAVAIRKNNPKPWKYCTPGMTEDQYIDNLIKGIKEENPSNKARWNCSGSLAKQMNRDGGLTDNVIQCDGSCHQGHHKLSKNIYYDAAEKDAKKYAGWSN